MINSVSSNYSIYNPYLSNAKVSTSEQDEFSINSDEGTKPPPPPPPPKGGRGEGPNLDSDGDNSWSLDELESYVSFSNSTLGIKLDADAIMEKYDTDGSGSIDESERVALKEDNAFNLPKPSEMPRFSMEEESTDYSESTSINIQQLIAAYSQSTSSQLVEQVSSLSLQI
jgi:hypothetical protein